MGTYRPNYRGGGGLRGGGTMSFGFPPFTPAVKTLIIVNVAVYFVVLFGNIAAAGFQSLLYGLFGFAPETAMHGWLWQFVTYGFLHFGISHILFNMLSLWMFGSQIEMDFGKRRFFEFYFYCLIGAALTTLALAGAGLAFANSGNPFVLSLAALWRTPTVGASGAVYGVLVAFAMLHGDQELIMFPIPFRIKAKYMVAILVLVVFASSLSPGMGATANFAHLGGIVFGFFYVRFLRHGLLGGMSERYYGARNAYYRWKRRRAARKFEVYMRKVDRNEYFDEYGNYRGPGSAPRKKDGDQSGPWVN